jgi:hypothetical protein
LILKRATPPGQIYLSIPLAHRYGDRVLPGPAFAAVPPSSNELRSLISRIARGTQASSFPLFAVLQRNVLNFNTNSPRDEGKTPYKGKGRPSAFVEKSPFFANCDSLRSQMTFLGAVIE